MPHEKGHFWGVWLIEKHCTAWDFGLGKSRSSAKIGGPILMIYMSYDNAFAPFGVTTTAPALKVLVALIC